VRGAGLCGIPRAGDPHLVSGRLAGPPDTRDHHQRTFGQDVIERAAIFEALERVADAAWERIARHEVRGRTVTLKVRYADFRTITRARSVSGWYSDREAFLAVGREMLDALFPLPMGIRLLGMTLSAILQDDEKGAEIQPSLPLVAIRAN